MRFVQGLLIFAGTVIICLGSVSQSLAVPTSFSFTGELLYADGTAYDVASASFFVSLHDAESGEEATWGPVAFSMVPIVHGNFVIVLSEEDSEGLVSTLTGSDYVWLELIVNGFQMTPRFQVVPVPFAVASHDSAHLGGIDASQYVRTSDLAPIALSADYGDLKNVPDAPWKANGADISYTGGGVGIGTSSPGARLHIQGSGAVFPIIESTDNRAMLTLKGMDTGFRFESGGVNQWFVGKDNTDNSLRFSTHVDPGTNDKLVIKKNGNVGIGMDDPQSALDVNGVVNASAYLQHGAPLKASPWEDGDHQLTYTEGWVGIGVDTADASLHVVNTAGKDLVAMLQASGADQAYLTLQGNSGGSANFGGHKYGASVQGSEQVQLMAGGEARLVVDKSTRVGIGVNVIDPTTTLDVRGEVRVGNSGAACEGATEGAMRWQSDDKTLQVCDGKEWAAVYQPPPPSNCQELQAQGNSSSGVYTISPPGAGEMSVYCDMTTDGGGWTLVMMAATNFNVDQGDYWGSNSSNVSALTNFAGDPNQSAWYDKNTINAICKSGNGYVKSRYANNKDGYAVTDVFAAGILPNLDLSYAMRGDSTYHMGWRGFGNGGLRMAHSGDWRRYNSNESDGLWCSDMHSYCGDDGESYGGWGPLCDTYGCDKSGQRTIEGHFWWGGSNSGGGVPAEGYGSYGAYGSRWCR